MERKIVIIGMDNTGKTTLVNDMKNILNIESIKSPGPNFTKEEMYEEIITDLSKEEFLSECRRTVGNEGNRRKRGAICTS